MNSTMLLILLLFAVLAAILALGSLLSRSRRRLSPQEAANELRELTAQPLADAAYRPLHRLFSPDEFKFLSGEKGFRPEMKRRLRKQRRKVMALYMRRLRSEFDTVRQLCRALVPVSEDPNFGILVTRQLLAFHVLYWGIHLRSLLSSWGMAQVDAAPVLAPLRTLQEAGRRVLASPAVQAAAVSAR